MNTMQRSLLACAACIVTTAVAEQPHIVIIVSDDLGTLDSFDGGAIDVMATISVYIK